MVSIELRFPAGRFHATPWDRHVNEGTVEWPPSPWRLMRALVATWHLKALPDLDAASMTSLVEVLASEPPIYRLPHASAAHTRHYMPIGQLKDGEERTTKVFDTFLHVERGEPAVLTWPNVEMTDSQQRDLDLLLRRMTYLGRAESWVDARVVLVREPETYLGSHAAVVPLAPDALPGSNETLIRVLCPRTSIEIETWRTRALDEEVERRVAKKRSDAIAKGKDPSAQRLSAADKAKIEAGLPRNLMDALTIDSNQVQRAGWSQAPGTCWLDYAAPRRLVGESTGPNRLVRRGLPTIVRFAVASQVPPRLTEAHSVADRKSVV